MIVFLGVLGLLVWLAEKYSMDHVLDGLDFATALDKTVVEPGEDFSWTMTINNRKRLMVPYLQMREQIPTGPLEITFRCFTLRDARRRS